MCLFGLYVCGDILLLLFIRPVQNLDYKGFCDRYLFKEKKKSWRNIGFFMVCSQTWFSLQFSPGQSHL